MAFLVVEIGSSQDLGKVFSLSREAAIIGRPTPSNNPDIALHDDYVSKHHAEISCHGSCFMLRDLGSKNGTAIDGETVEPGRLYPLRHDAAIQIAIVGQPRVVLRFKESDETRVAMNREAGDKRVVEWLKLDAQRKEAMVDGKLVPLSRKEYSLLLLLYRNAGQICSKEEIIAEVWPEAEDPGAVSDATIDQLVHRLRQKIEPDPSRPSRVLSKKGFGYILV